MLYDTIRWIVKLHNIIQWLVTCITELYFISQDKYSIGIAEIYFLSQDKFSIGITGINFLSQDKYSIGNTETDSLSQDKYYPAALIYTTLVAFFWKNVTGFNVCYMPYIFACSKYRKDKICLEFIAG